MYKRLSFYFLTGYNEGGCDEYKTLYEDFRKGQATMQKMTQQITVRELQLRLEELVLQQLSNNRPLCENPEILALSQQLDSLMFAPNRNGETAS